MDTKQAYNKWADSYDLVVNKTRDLENIALKAVLKDQFFDHGLEFGCGTGKNTGWLAKICRELTAIDFSTKMMAVAKLKHDLANVHFMEADITHQWECRKAGLVTCSLVLEHIRELGHIFEQAHATLIATGKLYICELHPYKQLQGSRAKFESEGALIQLEYFVHHLSDFFQQAKKHGFRCIDLQEWFDNNDSTQPPRLCSFLFEKV